MEISSLLEIIVLIAIVLEIFALIRHAQSEKHARTLLENKMEELMKKLDEHITRLEKYVNPKPE